MSKKQRISLKQYINRDEGFIVPVFYFLFTFFEKISLFSIIRAVCKYIHKKRNKKGKAFVSTYIFPEIWVVVNMIWAVIAGKLLKIVDNKCVVYAIVAYAAWRIFEMFIYQINVILFHPLKGYFSPNAYIGRFKKKSINSQKGGYQIKSATRSVLMFILNMIEYVLQFAVVYIAFDGIENCNSVLGNLLGSFEIFMNLDSSKSFLHDKSIMVIVKFETILGLFMNILCLARFVGMLPEVRQKDER